MNAPAFPPVDWLHERPVSFRGNVLEVNMTVPTVESLEGIRQGMRRDGMVAEIQSTTQRGDVHAGRLHVKLGPA